MVIFVIYISAFSSFISSAVSPVISMTDASDLFSPCLRKNFSVGREKGMSQRSLEIARKMLAKGMDEASVMDMTGLTAEEIKLLKAEM